MMVCALRKEIDLWFKVGKPETNHYREYKFVCFLCYNITVHYANVLILLLQKRSAGMGDLPGLDLNNFMV